MRLALTGILAAPDAFGRLRLMLTARAPDGAPDASARALAHAVRSGPGAPYRLASRPHNGDLGIVTVATPARRRAHWLATAAALRARRVRIEVLTRAWRHAGRSGIALDVVALEPLEPPAH